MEQLVDLFSDQVAAKDLELIITIHPDVPRQFYGDDARLSQVLINLVQNAVKFTESGEIVVGAELGVPFPTDQAHILVKFWISDTGTGIAADELPTLFEPFTQAEGYLTRQHEGAGLGLAICQRLVELMGGRIWIDSTPGQGSTFAFTVIMETRTGLAGTTVPGMDRAPAAQPVEHLYGRRVLVVEDSEMNRIVAVALLEEAGMRVETAENGMVALDKVTASSVGYYDAVLMDIQMPVMDGYETTQRIREWEFQVQSSKLKVDESVDLSAISHQPSARWERVPIIALTAHVLKGEKEKCLAADMDDHLAKPIDEKNLYQVLLKWVASQQEGGYFKKGKRNTQNEGR
jgi:CheY-like chemotaxis protein